MFTDPNAGLDRDDETPRLLLLLFVGLTPKDPELVEYHYTGICHRAYVAALTSNVEEVDRMYKSASPPPRGETTVSHAGERHAHRSCDAARRPAYDSATTRRA